MWTPDWLYERLPLVYLAAGGACLWCFGFSLALPSALLFFAAGLRAHTWRQTARNSRPPGLCGSDGGNRRTARYARR